MSLQRLFQLFDIQQEATGRGAVLACPVPVPVWLDCWTGGEASADDKDLPYRHSSKRHNNVSVNDTTMETSSSASMYSMDDDDEGDESDDGDAGRERSKKTRQSRQSQRGKATKEGKAYKFPPDNSIIEDSSRRSSRRANPSIRDEPITKEPAVASQTLSEAQLQQRVIHDNWPRPASSRDWREILGLSLSPISAAADSSASVSMDKQRDQQDQPIALLYSCPSPSNPQAPPRMHLPPSPPNARQSPRDTIPSSDNDSEQHVASALRKLNRLCRRLDVIPNGKAKASGLSMQDAPTILSAVMNQFQSSKSVQMEAYRIITNLAQHSSTFCETAVHPVPAFSHTVLESIVSGMKRFDNKEDIQVHGAGALIMLLRANESRCHEFVMRFHGPDVIVAGMRQFPQSRDLQELGLILFAVLCEFQPMRLPVVKAGGLRVADDALQRHQSDVPVVLLAQKAIVKFCKEQHLYDDDGKHAFRFYQEPARAAAVTAVDKEEGARANKILGALPRHKETDDYDKMAAHLAKSLLNLS